MPTMLNNHYSSTHANMQTCKALLQILLLLSCIKPSQQPKQQPHKVSFYLVNTDDHEYRQQANANVTKKKNSGWRPWHNQNDCKTDFSLPLEWLLQKQGPGLQPLVFSPCLACMKMAIKWLKVCNQFVIKWGQIGNCMESACGQSANITQFLPLIVNLLLCTDSSNSKIPPQNSCIHLTTKWHGSFCLYRNITRMQRVKSSLLLHNDTSQTSCIIWCRLTLTIFATCCPSVCVYKLLPIAATTCFWLPKVEKI